MATGMLLGISGSLRADSLNRKLIREAARLYAPQNFIEADVNLPLYDGDVEQAQGAPEAVLALARQIADAEAVVMSTPEYNKGPSGVLKNALDWISRVEPKGWPGKPVAVMSATGGRAGGERAQLILRTFMVPFRARVVAGPEMHLAGAADEFDADGRLTSSLYVTTLQSLMDNLRAEVAA
ncbi:MAG: NAD(P)H-dependent oxidoreductase [Pseudomonadota bacterium]